MRDWNVHLTRLHILQYVNRLRIYVSSLPESEPEAHSKLTGPEGVKTGARIADLVLQELGHPPPEPIDGTNRTARAARQTLPGEKRESPTMKARIDLEMEREERALVKSGKAR